MSKSSHDAPAVEPAAQPDPEMALDHLMLAVERMAGILEHAVSVVPAMGGLGVAMNALRSHVTAARYALHPPVIVPPSQPVAAEVEADEEAAPKADAAA